MAWFKANHEPLETAWFRVDHEPLEMTWFREAPANSLELHGFTEESCQTQLEQMSLETSSRDVLAIL